MGLAPGRELVTYFVERSLVGRFPADFTEAVHFGQEWHKKRGFVPLRASWPRPVRLTLTACGEGEQQVSVTDVPRKLVRAVGEDALPSPGFPGGLSPNSPCPSPGTRHVPHDPRLLVREAVLRNQGLGTRRCNHRRDHQPASRRSMPHARTPVPTALSGVPSACQSDVCGNFSLSVY